MNKPPPETMRILHVEDSSNDTFLLQFSARAAGIPIDWEVITTTDKALSRLKALTQFGSAGGVQLPDLILLDLLVPPQGGFVVLDFIRSQVGLASLPVVVLSGQLNPAVHTRAFELGASEFRLKPSTLDEMTELAHSLPRYRRVEEPAGVAFPLRICTAQ